MPTVYTYGVDIDANILYILKQKNLPFKVHSDSTEAHNASTMLLIPIIALVTILTIYDSEH